MFLSLDAMEKARLGAMQTNGRVGVVQNGRNTCSGVGLICIAQAFIRHCNPLLFSLLYLPHESGIAPRFTG